MGRSTFAADVLRATPRSGGMTASEVAAELNACSVRVAATLRRLVRSGSVRAVPAMGGARYMRVGDDLPDNPGNVPVRIPVAVLGVLPDQEVARQYQCNRATVARRRRQLGRPIVRAPYGSAK